MTNLQLNGGQISKSFLAVHYKNQCKRGSKLNCTTLLFLPSRQKTVERHLCLPSPPTQTALGGSESLHLHQKQSWHIKPKSRISFVWCPQRLASDVNPIRADRTAFRQALGSNTRAKTFLWEQQISWRGRWQQKEQCLQKWGLQLPCMRDLSAKAVESSSNGSHTLLACSVVRW